MRIVLARLLAGMLAVAPILATAAAPARAADLLDQVRSQGELVIGTSNDAPLSFVDPETKGAAGVLPDILREFLSRSGIKAELKVVAMPFNSLIPSIQSQRIQLIGDAMYVRPARQQVIDFTDTTFFNPESLDVAPGNPKKLHSLADLCGKTAGSYQGTTYIDLLRQASSRCPSGTTIDIRQYPTIQNVLADLSAGRIDAAVVDGSLSAYALKQNAELRFELVGDYVPDEKSASNCAFGIAKGNDGFLKAFNTTYAAMKADGTAAKIFNKWGLTPTEFFLNP
ncbi:substrate-binding periplasmic protein [Roseomonas elaeocarpi]|uniref:Substrate-binding periplasmic protein n=1 Tax=Roseomonas elaeocarpi TaxID=907779 RepID=A0ABV6JZT6_9PROT